MIRVKGWKPDRPMATYNKSILVLKNSIFEVKKIKSEMDKHQNPETISEDPKLRSEQPG